MKGYVSCPSERNTVTFQIARTQEPMAVLANLLITVLSVHLEIILESFQIQALELVLTLQDSVTLSKYFEEILKGL
jgi:hypothetical protein